jgi:hypothetical protein
LHSNRVTLLDARDGHVVGSVTVADIPMVIAVDEQLNQAVIAGWGTKPGAGLDAFASTQRDSISLLDL